MENSKIRNTTIFVMAAVLVIGTISMIIPGSFAQPYSEKEYSEDPYAKDNKKSTNVNIQKIKCINSNYNINGVEINQFPDQNNAPIAEALQEDGVNGNVPMHGNGNGNGIDFDKNLVNICVNVNLNGQEEGELFDIMR
ncbi:MAG: hypothetical protein ACE5SW_09125 [Nitrososphaeraceae archaeon]